MTSEKMAGGIASYVGYEYQILGTIWVALSILIKRQQCNLIMIEPVTQEDIELDLDVPEDQADAKVGCLTSDRKVWIQIKKKTGSNWTPAQLARIISRPSKETDGKGEIPRVRAAEAMDTDHNLFFVLLTSSQANSTLRSFVIDEIGQRTVHKSIPSALSDYLTTEKACRMGILEQLSPRRLTLEIREILQKIVHVPTNRHNECIRELTDSVRSRLLGEKPHELYTEEILAICRRFGGVPVSPSEPFVEPNNAKAIRQYLEEYGGIILTGPPGIGKTLFARRLSYEHRKTEDPYEIVRIEDPAEIENRIDDHGNILFLIEDPFGLYKLSEKVDRWITELPRIMSKARSDKRIVCTSRTSIMYLADSEEPPESIKASIFQIEERHYSYAKRSKILRLAMKDLDSAQRDFIMRRESNILKRLRIPYSLVEFIRSLTLQDKISDNDLDILISDASTQVISRKLSQEIEATGGPFIAGAVAIWTLLMTKRSITEDDALRIRNVVRQGDQNVNLLTVKVFNYLIQSKRLKPSIEEGYETHPSVIEGLESLFDRSPELSEDVIISLLEGYIALNQSEEAFKIISKLGDRKLLIPTPVSLAINYYLKLRVLTSSKSESSKAFRDFEKWYGTDDPLSLIVKSLMAKPIESSWGIEFWQAPELTRESISMISNSKEAETAVRNFIRFILPISYHHEFSTETLIPFLGQFGWDLSVEFLEAYFESLEKSLPCDIEMLLKGALSCKTPQFDIALYAALKALDKELEWWDKFSSNEYWKANQGHYNGDHSDHILEEPSERFAQPNNAIESVIKIRREVEGYQWILEHQRREDLVTSWAKAIKDPIEQFELDYLYRVSKTRDKPTVWKTISMIGDPGHADLLLKDMSKLDETDLREYFDALFDLLSPTEWKDWVIPKVKELPIGKKAAIYFASLGKSYGIGKDGELSRHGQILYDAFGTNTRKTFEVMRAFADEKVSEIENLDRSIKEKLVKLIHEASERIALYAVQVLYFLNEPIDEVVPALLSSEDPEIRSWILNLADTKTLLSALNDRDYRCRRSAMIALTREDPTNKVRKRIIAMSSDPSAPVRETCANIIGKHRWIDGLHILLELIGDTRNVGPPGYLKGNTNFHVARAAVAGLSMFGKLPDEIVRQLFDIQTSLHTAI